MPRLRDKKAGKEAKGGKRNVLNMMGYGGDSDGDSDDGMEAELAAILGEGPPKPTKKAPKKLLDWSIIDAQVASSMRDVDEDGDEEVTAEDENDFMSELNELVDEDDEEPSALLKPGPSAVRNRSPSPQPQRSGDIVDVLKGRKEMYEKAISNAQVAGESSKVRRLQRGVKTLDGLLRSAKAGKSVSEGDIPPMVATGQAPSTASHSSSEANYASPNTYSQNIPSPSQADPSPSQLPKPSDQLIDINSSPKNEIQLSDNSSSSKPVVSAPLVKEVNVPKVISTASATDPAVIAALNQRKDEYKNATLKAKRDGDKETALKYFKVLKQFDSMIEAANEGKQIELSSIPPSPNQIKSESQQRIVTPQKDAIQTASSTHVQQPETSAQPAVPSKPKTVLEALEQRMAKYQSSSDEAAKEGNGGKSRRMGRIVKQYKDAIRAHKAGKPVNFDELPVPPGFPPIPGVREGMQQETLMQKATALLAEDPEESPSSSRMVASQQLAPPAVSSGRVSPQKNTNATQRQTPSPRPQKSSSGTMSAYEQQVAFLENRQAAFKRAALAAKKNGDKAAALEYLRKMKGFDNMIEAAKNGLKVDITNVPQPPVEFATDPSSRDDGFEVIESSEISRSRVGDSSSKNYSAEEEDALYSRLLDSLKQQVKKARAYAQQMTHAGDVSGAEKTDRLAASSQVDYDYLLNCRRHGDHIPRFFYENKVFEMVRMNPDMSSEEMEIVVVQCIDLHGVKDNKIIVEWETPFPHDNPMKGRTDEGKGMPSPQFSDSNAIFRVPFNRKLKAYQRAIKSKSIKLDVIQKGGFLRSDKSIGACLIKLNPLEKHCEIHAVEELRDGRNVVGKIEAYVRLRTPLLVSDSQTVNERWVYVEHVKRPRNAEPSSHTSKSNPQPSSGSGGSRGVPKVNIASLEVLELELKVVNARIADCRKKGTSSRDYQREAKVIEQKIASTRKFLQDGGSHAKAEYVLCLKRHFQHLNNEAQAFVKQGKRDQAKLALTKKNLVKNELEMYTNKK